MEKEENAHVERGGLFSPRSFAETTGASVRDVLSGIEKSGLVPVQGGLFLFEDLLSAVNDYMTEKSHSDLQEQLRLFKSLLPSLSAEISSVVIKDLDVFRSLMEFRDKKIADTLSEIKMNLSELSAFISGASALLGQVTILGAADARRKKTEPPSVVEQSPPASGQAPPAPKAEGKSLKNKNKNEAAEPAPGVSAVEARGQYAEVPSAAVLKLSPGASSRVSQTAGDFYQSFSGSDFGAFFDISKMTGKYALSVDAREFIEKYQLELALLSQSKSIVADLDSFDSESFFSSFSKAFPSFKDCPTNIKNFHVALPTLAGWSQGKSVTFPPGLLWIAIVRNIFHSAPSPLPKNYFLPTFETFASFFWIWVQKR